MPVALKIEVIERGLPVRGQRAIFNRAMKRAWWKATNWFVGRFTEERFTESHGRKAGYAKRKPRYVARKRREKGHRDPLVWSGEARLLSGVVNVTSTSKQGRATFPSLRKLNWRNPNSNVNMFQEFLTILPLEEQAMTEQIGNAATAEIEASNVQFKTVIR